MIHIYNKAYIHMNKPHKEAKVLSQQRDYKNSFESRQRAALSALVLLVALVLSCLGAAVAVRRR